MVVFLKQSSLHNYQQSSASAAGILTLTTHNPPSHFNDTLLPPSVYQCLLGVFFTLEF